MCINKRFHNHQRGRDQVSKQAEFFSLLIRTQLSRVKKTFFFKKYKFHIIFVTMLNSTLVCHVRRKRNTQRIFSTPAVFCCVSVCLLFRGGPWPFPREIRIQKHFFMLTTTLLWRARQPSESNCIKVTKRDSFFFYTKLVKSS